MGPIWQDGLSEKIWEQCVGNSESLERKEESVKFQRNGCPRRTAIVTDRQITRAATTTPEKHRLVPKVFITSIKRRLREKIIEKWEAAGRVKLNKDQARSRIH